LKLGPKLRANTARRSSSAVRPKSEPTRGAWRKLDQSLNRLGVDTIDLYQVHGLEYDEELDEITGDDGALAAFREAKEQGLIDHMGLTSHGDRGAHPRCARPYRRPRVGDVPP